MHPSYLGWQIDWPVFVKMPFTSDSKQWLNQEHFNWLNRGLSSEAVGLLYGQGFIYHNRELEKQNKVGDRLSELTGPQLDKLVGLLNAEIKSNTNSTTEYTEKKVKQSKLDAKQRALLRSYLRNNNWIEDKFYEIRDGILQD
tara:strand:+ start:2092 stop:2517 length:426 start_codon:yes stop_codon:yes gene_type:complete